MAIAPPRGTPLDELRFANSFAALGDAFSERRTPVGIPGARLVAFSPDTAALIDLRPGEELRPEFAALTSGNALVTGMEPVAGALWRTSIRGLGRPARRRPRAAAGRSATLAGPWELQLKGGGQTAFSRFADGRAVVRSTIREFLASEALHQLGVPTTRALAMAAGDEPVLRERVERAATVIRMAPSFVRFGSFEIFHYRKQHAELRTLADYVIDRFYPECGAGEDRYARFFASVVERTAALMAQWQAVGFAHGVMNTDNMSILGLTLDYGPYGFMEAYEPGFICNHSDESGRYAFDRQPSVGLWNCYALAEALSTLIAKSELEAGLARFEPVYRSTFMSLLRAKLGLAAEREDDADLALELFRMLAARRVDWTNFWRALSHFDAAALALLGADESSQAWFDAYAARVAPDPRDDPARRSAMRAANPEVRAAQLGGAGSDRACEAGDDSVVRALLDVVRATLRRASRDARLGRSPRPRNTPACR